PPPKVPAGLRYGFTPPVPLADLLNRRLPGQVGVEVHPGAVLNGFISESAVGVGHATISGTVLTHVKSIIRPHRIVLPVGAEGRQGNTRRTRGRSCCSPRKSAGRATIRQ